MTPELKNMLEKGSISLLLDSYDALFSDFDPRPYNERAISDDFLAEAKRAVREVKPGVIEMHFLIPKHIKNPHEEPMIKERLRNHFKKHELLLLHETKHVVKNGILLAILGLLIMFFASLLAHYSTLHMVVDLLRVMLEPCGWFMVWYGLDQIFYVSKQQRPELDFYRKVVKAEIFFDTY